MEQSEKKITVLIADDDENLREIYGQKLMNEGFEVMFATNGEEAVKMVKENSDKIDLLLLDVVMPVMDGFDALEKIRGSWSSIKKLPIIMLTSLSDQEDQIRARELGADRFFVKPERTPADLSKAIAELFAETRGK